MKPGKIALIIIGAILSLIGLGLMIGGAGLGWAYATQRDDAGFFTTDRERFQTPTAALHSTKIDLGSDEGPSRRFWDDIATVRLGAERVGEGALFVGIGPERAVEDYLRGVEHDEVTDADFDHSHIRYRRAQGEPTALAAPQSQPFWVASASGTGAQSLDWKVKAGEWSIVVMNADGSRGITSDVQVGIKLDVLLPILIGLLIGGAAVLALGTVMIVFGARGGRAPVAAGAAPPLPLALQATPHRYPLQLSAQLDEPLSQWKWLVKWFLAIPHFVVLVFLWIAFLVLTVVAGFAILFTGRYPRGIFDFNVGVLRWSWRVSYYATSAIGTDRYPPFRLGPADYPAQLEVDYPDHLSRGLVLVKWWLLAIPHYLIVGLFSGGLGWSIGRRNSGNFAVLSGGLIGLLVLVAGVVLLFTKRYPHGIFDFVMGMNRWVYRVIAYAALMTDRYPPFRFDSGGSDPGWAVPPGSPPPDVDLTERPAPPAVAPTEQTAR